MPPQEEDARLAWTLSRVSGVLVCHTATAHVSFAGFGGVDDYLRLTVTNHWDSPISRISLQTREANYLLWSLFGLCSRIRS